MDYNNFNKDINIFELYRYFVGVQQEDLMIQQLKEKIGKNYLQLMKEIENTKPFASDFYEMRTDYRESKRFNVEFKEQVNRTFEPTYNKIKFEHAIQRNIAYNTAEFKEVLGDVLYYEFPLFYKSKVSSSNTGSIDIIAYDEQNNILYLDELKKTSGGNLNKEKYYEKTPELFIRAYAEITTYYAFFKELYEMRQPQFVKFLYSIIKNFNQEKYNNLKIKKGIIGPASLFNSKYIDYISDCEFYVIETVVDDLKTKKVKDKGLFKIKKYE